MTLPRSRAAFPSVAGIAAACVAGLLVSAAIMLTSINLISRGHDSSRWMQQTRVAMTVVSETAAVALKMQGDVRALAMKGSEGSGDGPGFRLDPSGLSMPDLPLEQRIYAAALELPDSARVPAETLASTIQSFRTLLQPALDLAREGRTDAALALIDGQAAWQQVQAIRNTMEASASAAGAALTGRIEEEARWRGLAFWVVLLGGGIGFLGVLAATVAAMLGIERRRALEQMLARAQAALARSERTRNGFLQVVGHDLRQPLQAIGLFATGLERRIGDSDSQQLLEGMRSAAASMNRMLSGLMDVSRLDAGATAVDPAPLRINSVLDPIRAEFSAMALSKGLELFIPASPLGVHTDPIMLESILRNLVSNAVRYTRRGRIDVTCEAEGGRVAVTVADTGIGIPAADLENIFQDFFCVAGAGRSAEGLGLGLGLVRRMAGLLDLPIRVTSSVGVGTSFILSIAAAKVLPPELALHGDAGPVEEVQPETALAGKRVLLVDDDEGLRRLLRSELQARGMLVTVASDPGHVCALFSADQDGGERGGASLTTPVAKPLFDIVLMDRDLQSTMTGPELLDHLAVRYGVMLPALVLSGTMDFRVIQELQESDYPWLAKPVPMPVLLREMQRRTSQAPERL